MIAMPEAWTAIVTMLVGWTSLPSLRTLNTSRMRTSETSMPNRRRSISVWASRPVESTQRAAPLPSNPSQLTTAPPSEEAQRESRRLKVGHTMVGIQFSLPDAVQRASNPGPHVADPSEFGAQDEPITLPISGLPPAAVGFMVLAAMILVALTGFLLLR